MYFFLFFNVQQTTTATVHSKEDVRKFSEESTFVNISKICDVCFGTWYFSGHKWLLFEKCFYRYTILTIDFLTELHLPNMTKPIFAGLNKN